MKCSGVIIPAEMFRRIVGRGRVHVDDGDSSFCKASREETTLAPSMSPEAITSFDRFFADVEGGGDARAGQDVEGARPEFIDRVERPGMIEVAAHLIESRNQRPPIAEPFVVHAGRQSEILRSETFLRRVTRFKCLVVTPR